MSQKNKLIITLFTFITLGFLAMQVPFSQILGVQNLKFSLFDFYGPIAAAFFSSAIGLVTVLGMQVINWAWHGFSLDLVTLLRFLPMLAAVLFFARRSKLILIVPAMAMIMFWIHPEGRGAWYYTLYWTIPFLAYFAGHKFIFARALGATFTAHSVGSIIFLYALNLNSGVWTSLMPIVWKERIIMAAGITITYIAFNYLFSLVSYKFNFQLPFVKLNHKFSIHHE